MNNHYVYVWYKIDTNEVIYVGKGVRRRMYHIYDRNPKFKAFINKYKCEPKIIEDGLSEKDAYKKEECWIKHYRQIGQAKCNFHDGGNAPPKNYGKAHTHSHKVIQLDLNGSFIKEWDCITEANLSVGAISNNSLIVRVCKGKSHSAYGFMWVYAEEYDENKKYEYKPGTVAKPILQYSMEGNFIKEWKSAKAINEVHGLSRSHICQAAKGIFKTVGGCLWRYKESEEYPLHITGVKLSETARKKII